MHRAGYNRAKNNPMNASVIRGSVRRQRSPALLSISYGGPGAVARARLALEIVRERLAVTNVSASEWRFDLIGVDSLYGETGASARAEPAEVRLRVAGRTANAEEAQRIGNEVETLYTNGPAAGGGVTKSTREVLAVQSILLPRGTVAPAFTFVEA